MKTTALAPANIAFIKYWGKRDEGLRLPLNTSISMNLDQAYTVTTVDLSPQNKKDTVVLHGGQFSDEEVEKIIKHLNRIRSFTGSKDYARVETKNSFAKGTGIASSASGFAALTVAGFAALGVKLKEKEMSIYARLGSGSAARSIPDGFVEWKTAPSSERSFAYSLYPEDYWDLRDIVVTVSSGSKNIPTTTGQKGVKTSPFLAKRLEVVYEHIANLKLALVKKDFTLLGETMEADCLSMYAIMLTQKPPLLYWTGATLEIMNLVWQWREAGLPVYFTIDAGPNVHLFCEAKDERKVLARVRRLAFVKNILVNHPAKGAHLIDEHLF